MKHSLDGLLSIVYRYYAREIATTDSGKETEEHTRLVAARRQAARDERWNAMLERISRQFPNTFTNRSFHLPAGDCDACYSFTISLSDAAAYPTLWFRVSFLAPYYIIYSSRLTAIIAEPEGFNVNFRGMLFYIPRRAVGPDFLSSLDNEVIRRTTKERNEIIFDLSPDEQTLASGLARDIESTFDCELMPPEVGIELVPDVITNVRALGEARLYDCFFSDRHQWVKRSQLEEKTRIELDVNLLPKPFLPVLTVLAAFYHIGLALSAADTQNAYFRALTDGVLHKDEMLGALSRMRLVESPRSFRALAAARELEALIAEWDGEGAPSGDIVAWAWSFLADWIAANGS